MTKSKIFVGAFILGAIAIGGFVYLFLALGTGLEETFEKADGRLAEEGETVEEVVEGGGEAPGALGLDIPAPLDVAAMPGDVFLTPEGVGIRVIKPGDGETFPALTDDVTVWYTGWTTDGAMFDSSHTRGEPDIFPLGRLIAGWQSAVPYMSKGEKALIWIPGDLAYDNRPDRPTAPKGMLVFEIELVDFAPPDDAGTP